MSTSPLRWAWATVWQAHPTFVALATTGALLRAAIPVAMVWVGKLVIDAVVARDADAVLQAIAMEAGLSAAMLLVEAVQGHAMGLLYYRAGWHGSTLMLDRAARAPFAKFEDPAFHDAMQRALPEASGRPMAVVNHSLALGGAVVALVGSVGLLANVSALIGLAMIISALPRFATDRWFQRAWFHMMSARATRMRELAWFDEALTAPVPAREVRVFGLADRLLAARRALFEPTWREDLSLATRRTMASGAASAVSAAIMVGLHLAVGLAAVRGELTVGDITLALTAFQTGEGAISRLLQSAGELSEDRLYLGHVLRWLDVSEPEDLSGATSGPTPGDGLRFEAVSFRYPGAEADALTDVALHIPPGQKTALVGVNGAGKTTLIKLALGLYQPTAGRLTFDGLDVRAWSPAALRARMSALFQDFVRYPHTLTENVTLGADGLPDALADALRLGLADGVAAELPRGADTRMGRAFEGGVDLSGGQWQRVALARALYRSNADLTLLDEPTAAMDPEAEIAVMRGVLAHVRGAVLLVTHRFSAVRLADHVLVLEGGRLVEQGDHAALMARDGRYAELYRLQADAYH